MHHIHRFPWPTGKLKRQAAIISEIYKATFDVSGDPDSSDRMQWPIDALGTPTLDWASPDGDTPEEGPSPLTEVGTITAGKKAPWQDALGADITCSEFQLGAHFINATDIDPTSDQDFVLLVLFRLIQSDPSSVNIIFGTGVINRFILLTVTAAGNVSFQVGNNISTLTLQSSINVGAWCLAGFTYDANGTSRMFIQGAEEDSGASFGGDVGSSLGFAINANTDGDYDGMVDIARVLYWHKDSCADIATATWHAALAEAVLGMRPEIGASGSVCTRTTPSIYYPEGPGTNRVHIMGANMPPAGAAEGLGSDEAISAKMSKNFNLAAGDAAALTDTYDAAFRAISAAETDDSANLGDMRECGPVVLEIFVAGIDA